MSDEPHDAPPLYIAIRAVLRPLVLGSLRPTVAGLEHVPSTGPAIICANHLSMLDPVIVPLLIDRPIVYIAKSEYFAFGPSRWMFEHLGVVPVDRSGGSAARATLDRGIDVLRSDGLLSLFPEGTRSPDGRLYRGKTGPVRMALEAPAPIVPVGITGTGDVMPPHARVPRFGPQVTVRFGPAFQPTGDPHDAGSVRAATDRLMHRIQQLTGQTYVDRYAAGGQAPGTFNDTMHD